MTFYLFQWLPSWFFLVLISLPSTFFLGLPFFYLRVGFGHYIHISLNYVKVLFVFRTVSLLESVCHCTDKQQFYGTLWQCIEASASARLSGTTFILSRLSKNKTINSQQFILGNDLDMMVWDFNYTVKQLHYLTGLSKRFRVARNAKRIGRDPTKHETGLNLIVASIIFILFFIKRLPIDKMKIYQSPCCFP